MKVVRFCWLLGILLLAGWQAQAKPVHNLRACWNQQVKPLRGPQYLGLRYAETLARLQHSAQPWQETAYTGTGSVWVSADQFRRRDTLRQGTTVRSSLTQLSPSTLLFQDYGDQQLTPVTTAAFLEQPLYAARYSPALLLEHLLNQRSTPAPESTPALTVYTTTLHRTVMRLYIRTADNRVAQVVALSPDELLGDVTTTYQYEDYATLGKLAYPQTIVVRKYNDKVTDRVTVRGATLTATAPTLLTAPATYALAPPAAPKPEVRVEKHSPHLHFINLAHTDDRALVVEFSTFLVVAEAPLNSENGELLIQEARKIAPNKPIRYFVAGHHHPHYLGGVRPLVHKGATVLTVAANLPYLQYLTSTPHTLQPDSLHLQPRPLRYEEVQGVKRIAEDGFEMQIHFIGSKSAHTNDYLIYYFPSEKLLFEDDLVWIARQGEPKKASARQAGLYQAVQELGLAVDTIVQSWPVQDYGVKTIIPFRELEQSMLVK